MGAKHTIRAISETIVSALKEISESVELEIGVDVEVIPKPVVKFFARIHVCQKLMNTKEQNEEDGSRKKRDKRLQGHDESSIKRNST